MQYICIYSLALYPKSEHMKRLDICKFAGIEKIKKQNVKENAKELF